MYRPLLILMLALGLTINMGSFTSVLAKPAKQPPAKSAPAKKPVNKPAKTSTSTDKITDAEKAAEKKKTEENNANFQTKCNNVEPMDLVRSPEKFLNQYVTINATFDKYTTLGLDYKPAMRSSKDFISFLIRRSEVKGRKHVIPLSEIKLIIPRKTAEKYTSLDTGDDVKIYGQVFSNALNDPWIEVNHITGVSKDITAPPKDENGNAELED